MILWGVSMAQTAQAVYLHRGFDGLCLSSNENIYARKGQGMTPLTQFERKVFHSPKPPESVRYKKACKFQEQCWLSNNFDPNQPAESCLSFFISKCTYTILYPIPSAHPSTAPSHLWRLAPSAFGNPPLLLASGNLKWNRPNRMHVEVSGSPGML